MIFVFKFIFVLVFVFVFFYTYLNGINVYSRSTEDFYRSYSTLRQCIYILHTFSMYSLFFINTFFLIIQFFYEAAYLFFYFFYFFIYIFRTWSFCQAILIIRNINTSHNSDLLNLYSYHILFYIIYISRMK